MKQTFTLFTAFALSTITAFGQINQTFENISDISLLTNNCWQFSDVVLSTENRLNGANSLEVLSTTTTGHTAAIITPYANLSSGSVISFNYKLSSKLSLSASRTIVISLRDSSGSSIILDSFTLDKDASTSILSFSRTSPLSGVRKIVVEITGNADGNSFISIDNLFIDASFNYNSPYGCNTVNAIPLPVKLKSFQGLSVSDRTQLQWFVADNENGNYFEIERSYDGKEFKTIGIVTTTQEQGDEIYTYKSELQNIAYYRLKVVNKNKTITYSTVLFIKGQAMTTNSINLLQNPVKQSLKFSFSCESNGRADVTIYSMAGIKVYQTKFTAFKGNNVITTALEQQISKGAYILEIKTIDGRSISKFLKD